MNPGAPAAEPQRRASASARNGWRLAVRAVLALWSAVALVLPPAAARDAGAAGPTAVAQALAESARLRQQGDLTRAAAVLEQAWTRASAAAPQRPAPSGVAPLAAPGPTAVPAALHAELQAELGAVLLQARRLDAAALALGAAHAALHGPARARVALDLATLALLRAQPDVALAHLAEAEALAPQDAAVQRSVRLARARQATPATRLAALRAVVDLPAGSVAHEASPVARLAWRLQLAHLALDLHQDLANRPEPAAAADARSAAALAAALLQQAAPDLAALSAATRARWAAEWADARSRLDLARGQPAAALAVLRSVVAYPGPDLTPLPDALLLRLLPRRAQLAQQSGQAAEALAAWRQAVQAAERLRPDLPIEDDAGRSTYRQVLEPVYLGLIQALLARDSALGDGRVAAGLRAEAVATLEQLRQAEMQDYLGDRCAVDAIKGDSAAPVPAGSAVLHVLLLEQRVELLLQVGQAPVRRLQHAVPALQVGLTARALAARLRNGDDQHLPLARQLYDWLLRPLEPWLAAAAVDTLVVVPHGPLRLLGFGALHDGQRYAIEKWAFASTTGLSMTHTGAPRARRALLLAGLSEPGAVVDQLDAAVVQRLLAATPAPQSVARGEALGAGLATRHLLRSMVPVPASAHAAAETPMLPDTWRGSRLRAALALPGVAQEVQALRPLAPGRTLLNPAFTVAAFERAAASGEHAVLHLATHGVFGGSAAASYVMAHDGLITLDGLQALLRSPALRRDPVELLSLSACETAEGDERSPLGLSGAALRARAQAVLGALWPVADAAAVPLMQGFYAAHLTQGLSKARALQQAQLALLHQPDTAHPFFWAPFLLIGNWL